LLSAVPHFIHITQENIMKNVTRIAAGLLFATLIGQIVVNAAAVSFSVATQAENLNVMTVESETALENFTGRTNKITGSINFDAASKTGAGTIIIDGSTIDTGVPLRNEHMRSADWFNFDKNKEIKFVTTRVRNISGDNYSISGNLTLRGVTKAITTTAKVVRNPTPKGGGLREASAF
jgi:polyisoprenoid-binding protein YceI